MPLADRDNTPVKTEPALIIPEMERVRHRKILRRTLSGRKRKREESLISG